MRPALGPGPRDRGFNGGMHELADIAAQAGDFAHQGRGNEIELLGRRQKHVVDLVGEMPAHGGELKLEFEIGDGTQASDHHAQAVLAREIHLYGDRKSVV